MIEFGKDTRLKFSLTDVAADYKNLGGEKSFDWTQGSTDNDISDKDGPAGVYTPGRVTFAVSGNVKLPDDGIALVYAAIKAGTVVYVQAAKGAIIKYQGPVSCGNWKGTFGTDGPVPYSFDMQGAGVPSVNDLGATQ